MISLLNNLNREYKFNITKDDILKNIYYADCGRDYEDARKQGCFMQFHDYNHPNIATKYEYQYGHLIKS